MAKQEIDIPLHNEDHKGKVTEKSKSSLRPNPENVESKKAQLEQGIVAISIADRVWHYRGEGGANLVISFQDEHQVVRFSKSKYADKDHDAKILEIAFYANTVMRNALGHHYVRPLTIGLVSEMDFGHVRAEAQRFRPVKRCKKDIMSHRVILSPDCVFLTPELSANTAGDTFSIEIKPKQGWHSETSSCHVNLCHRCLKQYAKLYKGKIDKISRYCPLDLFSGDDGRMKSAIFDLFENPHNRFKIYKNGDLIFTENRYEPKSIEKELRCWLLGEEQDDEKSSSEDFQNEDNTKGYHRGLHHLAALLCTVLLTNFGPESKSSIPSVPDDLIDLDVTSLSSSPRRSLTSCDTRSRQLPTGCVLERILSLQKHTELSDNDAKTLCEKLLNNIDDLERLHELVLWHPMTIPETTDQSREELFQEGICSASIDDLQQLQRFLLSVTAKDVSLLITFRQIKSIDHEKSLEAFPVVRLRSKLFRVMISVIDLDPKPVHRITSWVKRKEEWLQIYRSNSSKPKNETWPIKFERQLANSQQDLKPKNLF